MHCAICARRWLILAEKMQLAHAREKVIQRIDSQVETHAYYSNKFLEDVAGLEQLQPKTLVRLLSMFQQRVRSANQEINDMKEIMG